MVWRIKVAIKDVKGNVINESPDYLKDQNGNTYEFARKDECWRAIKSLEKGPFLQYKGLLEPAKV